MITTFAAAMRRAALSTRAFDLVEATRVIQDALARQARQRRATRHDRYVAVQRRLSALRIDPRRRDHRTRQARAVNRGPGGAQRPLRRLRKPLGEVLRMLREGRLTTMARSLTGLEPCRTRRRCPRPHCGRRAICGPLLYLRGRHAKLQALHSCLTPRRSARPDRHAAWLQAEPR